MVYRGRQLGWSHAIVLQKEHHKAIVHSHQNMEYCGWHDSLEAMLGVHSEKPVGVNLRLCCGEVTVLYSHKCSNCGWVKHANCSL